jgi:hypothetical protein
VQGESLEDQRETQTQKTQRLALKGKTGLLKVSEKYWHCVVWQENCGFSQRDITKILKISRAN